MGVSLPVVRGFRVLLLLVAGVLALVAAGAAGAIAAERFGDVSAGGTHTPGIEFVADAGVTTGCGGGDFCPSDSVTRGQMATFMHRLSGTAPGVAPSVNAATVGGLSAEALMSGAGDPAVLQALIDRIEELETLLEGVSRQQVGGRDTVRFEGMNVQVVNGTGSTTNPNGTGNLIIGYDTALTGLKNRSGSHYVVVGDEHTYTRFGGIVAGQGNTSTGDWASVTGGQGNTASGDWASVTGGQENLASNRFSSVSGGGRNVAGGDWSSILGGLSKETEFDMRCWPSCQ